MSTLSAQWTPNLRYALAVSKQGEQRGTGVVPPSWWTDLLQREHAARLKENERAKRDGDPPVYEVRLTQLGQLLARAVSRPDAWAHSAVSDFLAGKRHTLEMADAFCALYSLPRFEVRLRPDSEERARELERYARRFTDAHTVDRVGRTDKVAEALLDSATRHTEHVTSSDAVQNRGRNRRAHRGG